MLRVLSRLCGSNLQKKTSARIQKPRSLQSNRNQQLPRPSRNDSLIEARALAAYFYALNADGPIIVGPAYVPYHKVIENDFGEPLPKAGGG